MIEITRHIVIKDKFNNKIRFGIGDSIYFERNGNIYIGQINAIDDETISLNSVIVNETVYKNYMRIKYSTMRNIKPITLNQTRKWSIFK